MLRLTELSPNAMIAWGYILVCTLECNPAQTPWLRINLPCPCMLLLHSTLQKASHMEPDTEMASQ